MPTVRVNGRNSGSIKHGKVLVIEDSADHLVLIENAMRYCLPTVELVSVDTPDKALMLLNAWSTQEWELPKLILQDLYLPTKADGWHLLRQIKTMSLASRQIPVVVLSSSNSKTDIEEAYQFGSTLYLVKPFDFAGWLSYFQALRTYWWETATLPPTQFIL